MRNYNKTEGERFSDVYLEPTRTSNNTHSNPERRYLVNVVDWVLNTLPVLIKAINLPRRQLSIACIQKQP